MEKKFLDESTLTYLRNYIDGQDKVIYKTAANLVSSTHLESLTRPAIQPDAQVIPSITTTNEQQNLTIGDGLEIRDGALTTKKYVEANPTETGTTDLTSLKVGSTIYNISSGSSSGGGFNGFTLSISNSSDSKLLSTMSLYALTTNGIVEITSINDVINNVLYLFVDKTNIQSASFYCSSTTAYLSMGETTTSINFTSANNFMGGAKLLIFLNSDLTIYFSTSGGVGN